MTFVSQLGDNSVGKVLASASMRPKSTPKTVVKEKKKERKSMVTCACDPYTGDRAGTLGLPACQPS